MMKISPNEVGLDFFSLFLYAVNAVVNGNILGIADFVNTRTDFTINVNNNNHMDVVMTSRIYFLHYKKFLPPE